MNFYLHWWNTNKQRFSTEGEEQAKDFDGIVFANELIAKAYPGGYKYWLRRKLSEAPTWVLERKNDN